MAIYKRGSIYYVRLRVDGREIRRAVGPDKTQALQAQRALDLEIASAKATNKPWAGLDKFDTENSITFDEAASSYLEQLPNPKYSTLTSYRSILSAHLLPIFGTMLLAEIKPADIRKFQASLAETVTAVTVNNVVQLMRAIMAQAAIDELIQKDPCLKVERLKEQTHDVDPFEEDEITLILNNIDPYYRPFFTLQAYTGARPNELMALRFSDIDWQKREIRISKGRVRGHEGTPKTASSKRQIPLCAQAHEALLSLKANSVCSLNDYVFVDKKGQPVGKHLYRVWKKALVTSGLRHRPSYQLRHTFISQLLLKGFPVQYVAKVAGHSGIETTVRVYAKWIDGKTQTYDSKLRDAFSTSSNELSLAQ